MPGQADLKSYLIARCNPLTRSRKVVPEPEETLEKIIQALKRVSPAKVRIDQVAGMAAWDASSD